MNFGFYKSFQFTKKLLHLCDIQIYEGFSLSHHSKYLKSKEIVQSQNKTLHPDTLYLPLPRYLLINILIIAKLGKKIL